MPIHSRGNGDYPFPMTVLDVTCFLETLERGRCGKLRRPRMKDEDAVEFSTEPLFFTVLNECLVG